MPRVAASARLICPRAPSVLHLRPVRDAPSADLLSAGQNPAAMTRKSICGAGCQEGDCPMRPFVPAETAALAAALIAVSSPACAWSGQAMEKSAKISMTQASAIALKARPGAITDCELEREGGGSGLRHSFDEKSGDAVYEVGVDAMTGK